MPSFTVRNESGMPQTYAIFSERPTINGPVEGQIWQLVYATARAPPGGQAQFETPQQYFALAASARGSPQNGGDISVAQTMPVRLGTKDSRGTSVEYNAQEGMRPQGNNAPNKTFEIVTGSGFSRSDASRNNYLIGLGGDNQRGKNGPLAVFTPQPNASYKIEPSNTYYLTRGQYRDGTIIDPRQAEPALKLDFDQLTSPINVMHTPDGRLIIQR